MQSLLILAILEFFSFLVSLFTFGSLFLQRDIVRSLFPNLRSLSENVKLIKNNMTYTSLTEDSRILRIFSSTPTPPSPLNECGCNSQKEFRSLINVHLSKQIIVTSLRLAFLLLKTLLLFLELQSHLDRRVYPWWLHWCEYEELQYGNQQSFLDSWVSHFRIWTLSLEKLTKMGSSS